MRILHLLSAPTAGGAEIYVKDLALEFVRVGAEPILGFVSRAADVDRSPQFEAEFLAELDVAGVRHVFVGHECRRNPLLGAWRIRRLCRTLGVDVYHSHLKYGIAFASMLSLPVVHTHHNSVSEAPRWMFRAFNLLVDEYVGISTDCARNLEVFTGRSVTTIRNGINPERIAPGGARQRHFQAPLNCVAVGRLFEQKNYPLLIDAVALLDTEVRKMLRVSIVGEGPAFPELQERIASRGVQQAVELVGNRSDIPELLAESQVFLMSSAWEGLPISLLEATVTGLPFIATDVGGCSEVAQLCGNGIIVPSGNAAAFAEALGTLFGDRERLHQLSANAVRNGSIFAIETAAAEHLRLYRQVLLAGEPIEQPPNPRKH